MPVVQSYPIHVFCHADLNTTDVQAARRFYGTLLGWEFTEMQLEGQPVYSMGRIDGHAAAGLAQLPPNALEAGMHPSWAPYVHVADVGRTLAAGEEAGGTTVMPPFAVEDFASIAVMMDAAGAAVALFQAGTQIGAGIVREPGSMVWFEPLTEDRSAAAAYYRSVFGWGTEQDRVKQECTLFVGDPDLPLEWRYTGGLDDGPSAWLSPEPLWLVYFQVADIDASVQLALDWEPGCRRESSQVPWAVLPGCWIRKECRSALSRPTERSITEGQL